MSVETCVVIVGRPNVGKSTLFNRLYGRRKALVLDTPGVTRDRNIGETVWRTPDGIFPMRIVDTGGLGHDDFEKEIAEQVDIALKEASVVLVVFDAQTGLTPADERVVSRLRRANAERKIPLIAVVNKADTEKKEELKLDFFQTGIAPLIAVSAEHDRGFQELKQLILKQANSRPATDEEAAAYEAPNRRDKNRSEPVAERQVPHIAIVGRPNVGKSTLLNAILGEERMITSPVAGTTVDAVDTDVTLDGRPYVLVDTAGIRKKARTKQGVEVLSVVMARKTLERADIALLVLDGEGGVTDQDEKIGGLIEDAGCCVILVLNKWDLQEKSKEGFTKKHAAEFIRKKMGFLGYAPIVFTSALNRKGLKGLGDLIDELLRQREVKITTHELTEFIRGQLDQHNPNNAKVYIAHQTSGRPPTFVVHVNDPKKVHFSLKRHMVNGIRERWGYMGSPMRLKFQKSTNRGFKNPTG